jgi:hypothetical protein
MSKKSVPVLAHKFIVVPARLIEHGRDYLWIFLILLNKANSSRSACISGDELIKSSNLSPTQVRDALHWLMVNGYVKKALEEDGRATYLLSIEGALPYESSNLLRPSSSQVATSILLPPIKQKERKFVATLGGTPSIPPQLGSVASVICDFFNNHKGGVKSKRSFDSLLNSLMQIFSDPGGGIDAVRKQLDLAIQKSKSGERKWDSITYQNWDKFGRSKKPHWEQNARPSTQQIVNTFEEDIPDF